MGRPADHLLLGLWLEVKLLLLPDGRAALARPAVECRSKVVGRAEEEGARNVVHSQWAAAVDDAHAREGHL